MFTKGILIVIFVATVDQTLIDPVFVGPLVGGGGLVPLPGGPLSPALGIVPPNGDVPRRAPTPPGSAQPEGRLSPPPDQRPSPGQKPIQNQPVWTGPHASPPQQQELDRTTLTVRQHAVGGGSAPSAGGPLPPAVGIVSAGGEAPRRTGTPEGLVRPGAEQAPPTEGRPSPVPRPFVDTSVLTGPPKTSPKQEQDRPFETARPQAVGGGLVPSAGGSVGIAPPGGKVPRRTGTTEEMVRPGDGAAPPADGRPAPVPRTFEEPSVRTGPPKSSPKQEQARSVETDREQAVRGGPAPSAGGSLQSALGIAPIGGDVPRRTSTPEELVRPGNGPTPATNGRPSPVPRPIEDPAVRTGPPKTPTQQEQDRPVETARPQAVGGGLVPSAGGSVGIAPPGGKVPRRTGTTEEMVRPGDGAAPPADGRPAPVPRTIEEPSVRTGPPKTSPKQEQARSVETDREQAVRGGPAPSAGGSLQSALGIAPIGGDVPRRTSTPEELVRPGNGPTPATNGRPSPVPRPIEDPAVRTGPPKTPTQQEQDRPGSEAPRRRGPTESFDRSGEGPAKTTEGRPSPVRRPIVELSKRTGPAKASPTQEQDRPVETDRQQAVGGGPAPSAGGPLQSAVGFAPISGDVPRRTSTPEELVRPGNGPIPATDGRPSPFPRPIEDPAVRTGPPKTPTQQEQDRPVETDRQQAVVRVPAPSASESSQSAVGIAPIGEEVPRRTVTPTELVRPRNGTAPPTEERPSPVPRPIEDPSVRTGPSKTSRKEEQDRPGGEAPRRTGRPETLVRSGDGPAPPTEGRPSPVSRPTEERAVRTGPPKPSPKQERDRPVETDRQKAVVRGPAPSASESSQSAVEIAPIGEEVPRRTVTPTELVRPRNGTAPPTEGRPSPVPRPIEDRSVRTGPSKTSSKEEQDRPGGEAPRRTGRPETLVRPGDEPAPPTGGRPSPVSRPTEEPSVRTGHPKPSPKQEQDRPVETVRPQTVRGSPEPPTVGVLPPDGERRKGTQPAVGRPGDGPVPLSEERRFPGPRPIQHPPVWTGSSKTSAREQDQYRPIQHPPVWTGLPKTSPTRQQENEAAPPAEGATPPRVGRPTPSSRPIQHPPVWTGPRKTPRKQQQRQQEPVSEQEVEEPPRGRRHNLKKSSNPQPVTTPPSTVPTNPAHIPFSTKEFAVTTPPTTAPTNPPRIPFSTKEFAVTTPPTTVPTNPHNSQPCSIAAVCGSDGYTYFSECFLPGGVWKECDGSCPCPVQNPQPSHPPVSACMCPRTYNPVCGVDGNTYDNDCWRRCNYVAKDCEGHCPCDTPEPVSCSCKNNEYNPVCSVFGNAYDNECELRCSGESKQCDNECPCTQEKSVTHTECVCNPYETDPVCTTDGETIWNGCEAMCAGKEIACSSTCPC